jgi:hypothetical protein
VLIVAAPLRSSPRLRLRGGYRIWLPVIRPAAMVRAALRVFMRDSNCKTAAANAGSGAPYGDRRWWLQVVACGRAGARRQRRAPEDRRTRAGTAAGMLGLVLLARMEDAACGRDGHHRIDHASGRTVSPANPR